LLLIKQVYVTSSLMLSGARNNATFAFDSFWGAAARSAGSRKKLLGDAQLMRIPIANTRECISCANN